MCRPTEVHRPTKTHTHTQTPHKNMHFSCSVYSFLLRSPNICCRRGAQSIFYACVVSAHSSRKKQMRADETTPASASRTTPHHSQHIHMYMLRDWSHAMEGKKGNIWPRPLVVIPLCVPFDCSPCRGFFSADWGLSLLEINNVKELHKNMLKLYIFKIILIARILEIHFVIIKKNIYLVLYIHSIENMYSFVSFSKNSSVI